MRSKGPVLFQRRHFEFIAETIRNMPFCRDQHLVATAFASALANTNAQFSTIRFIAACDGVPHKRSNRGKKVKPVVTNTPDFSLAEIKKAERLIDKIGG